jgi:hypothetical protein
VLVRGQLTKINSIDGVKTAPGKSSLPDNQRR